MTIKEQKQLIRKDVLAKRAALTESEIADISSGIFAMLQKLPQIDKANTVMGYLAFGNEINIDKVLQSSGVSGKNICVPYITDTEKYIMQACYLNDFNAVCKDNFGIRTPQKLDICKADAIDVILVPGAAFSVSGQRLGLGRGYYDKFLAKATNAIYIGIAADYNFLPTLPTASYDVNMHYIVTPTTIKQII